MNPELPIEVVEMSHRGAEGICPAQKGGFGHGLCGEAHAREASLHIVVEGRGGE